MCGILFSTLQNDPSESFDLIKYRGPDNTTTQFIDNLWFCHHRLNIIEILNKKAGDQPIISDRYILICNGEIYNYKNFNNNENFQSDCSAIIEHFDVINHANDVMELDGDYAFVLYDRKLLKIIVGRDPIGLKPLFMYHDHKHLIVASEIKVIENILLKNKMAIENIIPVPINSYSTFVINKVSDTILAATQNITDTFTGVKKPPSFANHANDVIVDLKDYQNNIHLYNIYNLLKAAVKKRLFHTNKPVALLCSGGLDSSIICALVFEILSEEKPADISNLNIFTIVYETGISYDEFYTDTLMTAFDNLAQELRPKLTKVRFNKDVIKLIPDIIQYLETYDPNTIRAAIPMFLLAKHIRENTDIKVILSGEISDELFMGYNYFNRAPTPLKAAEESKRLINNLHSFDLLRAERCFAVNGLELRCPFGSQDLIKYVLNLDPNLLIPYKDIEKSFLRESFRLLFKKLNIPEKVLMREKERMSDGCGYNWIADLLNSIINYANDDSSNFSLEYKLGLEKLHYKEIYDTLFKTQFIIPRELPEWVDNTAMSVPLLTSTSQSKEPEIFEIFETNLETNLEDLEDLEDQDLEDPYEYKPIVLSQPKVKYNVNNPPPLPDFLKAQETRKK